MMRQYKDIDYTLRRSRRRTASIYIERDGRVSVLVPERLSDVQVEQVIETKRSKIYKGLAEWDELNAKRHTREFVNGEGFLYLGRSHRLKLIPRQTVPLALRNGHFCLRSASSPANAERSKASFRAFYTRCGLPWLRRRVESFRRRLGLNVKIVRVMDLKHRWASCTPTGAINFDWRVMMAPATVIDYIVVHELSHLIHPKHSSAFWSEVDKVLPDYRVRREWLRVHGVTMSL